MSTGNGFSEHKEVSPTRRSLKLEVLCYECLAGFTVRHLCCPMYETFTKIFFRFRFCLKKLSSTGATKVSGFCASTSHLKEEPQVRGHVTGALLVCSDNLMDNAVEFIVFWYFSASPGVSRVKMKKVDKNQIVCELHCVCVQCWLVCAEMTAP